MKYLFFLFYPLLLTLNAQTYTFVSCNNNTLQVIGEKILQRAYQKADLKIETVCLDLEESLKQSNSGFLDGELVRVKKISKVYPNLISVPVKIMNVEAVAFSKDTKIQIKNWEDLKAYSFTIVRGTKFIEIATKDMSRHSVNTVEEAFTDLNNNCSQIIVIPKKSAVQYTLKKDFTNIKAVSQSLQTLELYHFIHKKNSHLIPLLEPILKEMKENGEFENISQYIYRNVTH